MNGAADLLNRLAPAARERVLREYIAELVTGKATDNPHPGVADMRSLPVDQRTLGAILQGIESGGRTSPQLPQLSRALLSDVLDPALIGLAKQYPAPVHRAFVGVQVVPNYREQSFIGSFDGLEVSPVGELGAIPVTLSDSISFELERGSVKQHGRILRIPRRDVINDSAGVFFRNAGNALIAAAYRAETSAVFDLLENGATLRDGQAWFDSSNSVSGVSVLAAIENGFELFASQKFASGEYADVVPAVLVIPPDWSFHIGDTISDILLNLANGGLRVIKSGRVTSGYLFSAPEVYPSVVLAGLTPNLQPVIDTNPRPKMNLDVGLEVRVLHSFAAVPVSRIGVVKMTKSA